MHLVDKQNRVVGLGALGDHVLKALLELTAILGTSHKTGQVERPDIHVEKVLGHVAGNNLLRQALNQSSLAHTGIAQDKRVVLGAAREDLHHARNLFLAADNRIEFALASAATKIDGKLLQRTAGNLGAGNTRLTREEGQASTGASRASTRHGAFAALIFGREFLYRCTHGSAGDAQALEDIHSQAVALGNDGQQQMLGRDVRLVVLARQAKRALHHRDDERREGKLCRLGRLVLGRNRGTNLFELLQDIVVRDIEGAQSLGGNAVLFLGKSKQQMLGSHLGGFKIDCLLLCKRHDLAGAVGESIQHMQTSNMLEVVNKIRHRHRCSFFFTHTMVNDNGIR